jgi:RNA polymerase sigma-70 factor (ECF subfamily)
MHKRRPRKGIFRPVANTDDPFRNEVLKQVPGLLAFAIKLSGDQTHALDLVQTTVERAIKNKEQFKPGTNLAAWTTVILRNLYLSEYRKAKREVVNSEIVEGRVSFCGPEQEMELMMNDLRMAIERLPQHHREAFLLISNGARYADAARAMDCAEGTIKSRLFRARATLLAHFAEEVVTDDVPGNEWREGVGDILLNLREHAGDTVEDFTAEMRWAAYADTVDMAEQRTAILKDAYPHLEQGAPYARPLYVAASCEACRLMHASVTRPLTFGRLQKYIPELRATT